MQPKKSLILISLLIGALICALSFRTVEAQFWGTNDNLQQPNGMFNQFVVTPIKGVFNRAKALFGFSPVGGDNGKGVNPISQLPSYSSFLNLFNKTYSPEELPKRMALFAKRSKKIEESNKLYEQGREMFAMKINDFADWDEDELKTLASASLPSPDQLIPEERKLIENGTSQMMVSGSRFGGDLDNNDVDTMDEDKLMVEQQERIPATKDWRESGCIAEPMNQLKCGACYALATMNVVESQRCINRRSSAILSPQQIVDCATSSRGYNNFGCNGGWPTRVFKYLQDVQIVARETCYPFVRKQTRCQEYMVKSNLSCGISASSTGGKIQYKLLNNERDILYHVAKTGPVVTVMKATDKFVYYGKGIFNDHSCSGRRNDVDHAISIVGYGSENGIDYWIIKNSWGTTSWGENGFGRYRRGRNVCSIGHWGWVVTN